MPVLWDRVTKRIVSNSDDDLMRMFNGEFNRFTESSIDLYPEGPAGRKSTTSIPSSTRT